MTRRSEGSVASRGPRRTRTSCSAQFVARVQPAGERQADFVRVVEQSTADEVGKQAADERHARQPERGGQFGAAEKIRNPLRLAEFAQ
jgi:hypothetical protein